MPTRPKAEASRPPPASVRPEVTINIAMPRDLHRHLSIAAAALDVSLKDALIDAARQWVAEHAAAVAEAAAQLGDLPAQSREEKK